MYDITDNLFTLLINITTVYPNIIINTCDHSDIVIPKHWDLSTLHQNDIRNIIKVYNKSNGAILKLKFVELRHQTRSPVSLTDGRKIIPSTVFQLDELVRKTF